MGNMLIRIAEFSCTDLSTLERTLTVVQDWKSSDSGSRFRGSTAGRQILSTRRKRYRGL